MAKRTTTSKKSAKDKAGKNKSPESSINRLLRNYWLTIGVPVTVVVLGAWLTPLPGYVIHILRSHSNSPVTFAPLTATVQLNSEPCGRFWVVNRRLSTLPKPPISSSGMRVWAPWLKASGAVDANRTYVYVTLQAKPGYAVYITDIQFDVLKRNPPIQGRAVSPLCGGPVLGRFVDAELDSRPPRVLMTSSDPQAYVGPNRFPLNAAPLKLPYEVTNTDGLVLILEGQVQKFYCVWTADITWSSNGRIGELKIDDNGKPFETTPYKP